MTVEDRSTTMTPARRPITRVSARGVVKRYGPSVALRGVDIGLEAGRVTLIEGANGSGKTTLLGVIGTMIRPSSGEVTYDPLGDDLDAVRAEIGWLSHDTLAYADLSGRENIELAARLQGLDGKASWAQAQERFELGAFADRPLRTNSRGQRQRVALARALVHAPSLLLLDEPTTGLDRSGVVRLLTIIDEEVTGGAVVAVVSHEAGLFGEREVTRISLDRGRISSG